MPSDLKTQNKSNHFWAKHNLEKTLNSENIKQNLPQIKAIG